LFGEGFVTFDAGGNMVLGFRDRRSDSMPHFRTEVSKGPSPDLKVGFGVGDIVRAERKDGAWTADAADEFFDDRASGFGDEVALGGLAELSEEDLTASGAYVTVRARTAEGVYWFDDLTGNRRRHEQVFDAAQMVPLRAMLSIAAPVYAHCSAPRHWTVRGPGTVGDVEALCALAVESPPTPTAGATSTPTAVATASGTPATSPSPTDTLVPTATPTRTETPTPQPLPLYLPIPLRERCDPQHQHADVVLVLDTSSSMEGRKKKMDKELHELIRPLMEFMQEKISMEYDLEVFVEVKYGDNLSNIHLIRENKEKQNGRWN
jgi:hypothetical protein